MENQAYGDSYEKVNYRQVGTKKTTGKVLRGKVHKYELNGGIDESNQRSITSASIPSKFETRISTRQAKDQNGFGSRTQRFAGVGNDLPGPGSYYQRSTMVRNADTCPSVSKKGYLGGFVSSTGRFNHRKQLEDAVKPGPGHYSPTTTAARSLVESSTLPQTSMFKEAKNRKGEYNIWGKMEEVPGPGDYHPSKDRNIFKIKQNQTVGANFRQGPAKIDYIPKKSFTVPAPGAYQVANADNALKQQGRRNIPNAAFKSMSERTRDVGASQSVPGPTDYEVQSSERWLKKDPGVASMFSNTQQDRWGQPYQPKTIKMETPGPGWYSQELVSATGVAGMSSIGRHRAAESGAAFKSRTRRAIGGDKPPDARPPGPAFYKPENLGQKSFLLNSQKRWI